MDEWTKALRRIQHIGYNRALREKNKWYRRLEAICKSWREIYYHIEGSRQKKPKELKECTTWDECFKRCLKKWNDNRRYDPWTKRLETIRSNWRDRGKRIRGRMAHVNH